MMGRALGWSYAEMLARVIGAGLLRAVRPYRPPLVTLAMSGGRLVTRSTAGVRKGALLHPLAGFEAASPDLPAELLLRSSDGAVIAEPVLRFMSHSVHPSVALRYSRGRPYLVATRAIKRGEELTFDRGDILAIPASETQTVAVTRLRKLDRAR